MTTGKPGLPVSERTLRAFGHHRRSKKGASLRKEGANSVDYMRLFLLVFRLYLISTL
jgi:hypothetical protein